VLFANKRVHILVCIITTTIPNSSTNEECEIGHRDVMETSIRRLLSRVRIDSWMQRAILIWQFRPSVRPSVRLSILDTCLQRIWTYWVLFVSVSSFIFLLLACYVLNHRPTSHLENFEWRYLRNGPSDLLRV